MGIWHDWDWWQLVCKKLWEESRRLRSPNLFMHRIVLCCHRRHTERLQKRTIWNPRFQGGPVRMCSGTDYTDCNDRRNSVGSGAYWVLCIRLVSPISEKTGVNASAYANSRGEHWRNTKQPLGDWNESWGRGSYRRYITENSKSSLVLLSFQSLFLKTHPWLKPLHAVNDLSNLLLVELQR